MCFSYRKTPFFFVSCSFFLECYRAQRKGRIITTSICHLFRNRILTLLVQNEKHMLTCQSSLRLVVTLDLITSPVVSWRGCETPPQYRGSAVMLCSTTSRERTSYSWWPILMLLSARICLFGGFTFFLDINVSIFFLFS